MNYSRGEVIGVIVGSLGLLAWAVPFPGYLELRFLGLFALIYLGYRVLKRLMAAGDHHRRLSQLTLRLFLFGGLATVGSMALRSDHQSFRHRVNRIVANLSGLSGDSPTS
jgi:hypothetical protein